MDNTSIISKLEIQLVRLKQASELTGCNIYGKAEYFNPIICEGQSCNYL